MKRKLYSRLADLSQAIISCQDNDNDEWEEIHRGTILDLVELYLPQGSGFDVGCSLDPEYSDSMHLTIHWAYHAMNAQGFYAGWVEGDAIVTANLAWGFDIELDNVEDNTDLYDDLEDTLEEREPRHISAEDYGLLDYIADTLAECLNVEIDY